MKKVLVISETIFSDRLFKTLGLQSSSMFKSTLISSTQLNDIEKKYFVQINQNKSNFYKFTIIKFLSTIHKYVSPLNINRTSLNDHLEIDSQNWSFTKKALFRCIIYLFILFKPVRKISLILLKRFSPKLDEEFENYLDKFDAVFFFSLGNLKQTLILPIYKYFNKKKLPSICYIQSWDNPSTKGYTLIKPTITLTWTELMRKELVQYMDFNFNETKSVGTPIFANGNKKTKNSRKKHILFATKSPKTYPHNFEISKIIAKAIKNEDINYTVRIHPLAVSQSFINERDKIIELSKNYGFNVLVPSSSSKILLNEEYETLSKNIFYDASLFISVFSTMNLEAAFMNIETLNIDFDGNESDKFSYRQSIYFDRRQIHNRRALSYGFIKNIKNENELVSAINQHIINGMDKNNLSRRELVKNECEPTFEKQNLEFTIHKLIKKIIEIK